MIFFLKNLNWKYQWMLATWLPIPANNILVVSGYGRNLILTLFRMGLFGPGHKWRGLRWDGGLPKICPTYSTMMKLSTIIPSIKKMQKIYESCYTYLEFCWHQHFFSGNQQILLYQEMYISFSYIISNSYNIFRVFKDILR